jgi:hypothetical protein
MTATEYNLISDRAEVACVENYQMVRRMLHFANRYMPTHYLPNDETVDERAVEQAVDDLNSLVDKIIHARLTYHDPPDALVSGGAKGVDTWAEGQAQALGLVTIIHHPIVHGWAIPGGYRDRNLRIAHDCDYLVRIACRDSSTYGSGYTADVAQRLGKPVERITL